MKFSYLKLRSKLAPIVPIELKGREWVSYDAYVDSGAGYSVFHSDAADDLEIKLEDGKKAYITVGDGSQIIVYLHKVPVRIADQELEAILGFSRHLGIGFNIIGRLDLFDGFRICFDESEKIVEFYPKVSILESVTK